MGVCEKLIGSVFADGWRKQPVGEVGTDPEGWTVCRVLPSVCFFSFTGRVLYSVWRHFEKETTKKRGKNKSRGGGKEEVLQMFWTACWKSNMLLFMLPLRLHIAKKSYNTFWVVWWLHDFKGTTADNEDEDGDDSFQLNLHERQCSLYSRCPSNWDLNGFHL